MVIIIWVDILIKLLRGVSIGIVSEVRFEDDGIKNVNVVFKKNDKYINIIFGSLFRKVVVEFNIVFIINLFWVIIMILWVKVIVRVVDVKFFVLFIKFFEILIWDNLLINLESIFIVVKYIDIFGMYYFWFKIF